ncbi:MAG: diacylglycerol kinase family protein [Oscillospiraceae bacterium]|nr:diacylglycerol kinase family protein [Oscillospiraceae bacterium]
MGRQKKKRKWYHLGFVWAVTGMWSAFKSEKNIKATPLGIGLVVGLAIWLKTSAVENAILALACGLSVAFEMMNTAVEKAVDLACEDILEQELKKDPIRRNAKLAKDIAAGSSVFFFTSACVAALFIFGPKILEKI